ncbi:MAG: hypothetical protein LUE21_06300 [Oscillospiraceae bacterium]|nr:hypothetical protein [Oscillospiraceae bacterium]
MMGWWAGDMTSFLGQVGTALADLSDFSKALLPCIAAAAAAAGNGAAGAARYTASALGLDILMTIGVQAILPLIYAYAAVSTADAALPGGALGGPVKLLSWLCKLLLTGLTTVFTLCLTLSGIIAGSADKLAGSLTKTAISAALPVVGSILSDAADAYLAGAALLRNGVGIFGLAAVLCVCIGPVLGLGLHYLLFKGAACIAEPFAGGRLSALIGNIGTAYGMALGLLGERGGYAVRFHRAVHGGGDRMKEWIMGIVAASVLRAIAMALTPPGRVRSVTGLVSTIVCALALVSPVMEIDLDDLAVGIAEYEQMAEEVVEQAEEETKMLNRTYIEEEYEAYILDKAAETGVAVQEISVTARWDEDALVWYPWQVVLGAAYDRTLSQTIEAELGIPAERQEWSGDEG